MLPDIQPGNTKILYFFNCLLDGMHTKYYPFLIIFIFLIIHHIITIKRENLDFPYHSSYYLIQFKKIPFRKEKNESYAPATFVAFFTTL